MVVFLLLCGSLSHSLDSSAHMTCKWCPATYARGKLFCSLMQLTEITIVFCPSETIPLVRQRGQPALGITILRKAGCQQGDGLAGKKLSAVYLCRWRRHWAFPTRPFMEC